ncbi:MAG: hypothetical protein NFCOHLIN_02149 [Gammaproteobacteria bacterium]|nr:hypothetical protein [Gammaproteobacteria bacterium]
MHGEPERDDSALNTAYAYNTRPCLPRGEARSGWHGKIDELLRLDHSFLGYRYSDSGVLFRGLPRGLTANLRAGRWLPSVEAGPLGSLERQLGVYLLSHDLSDALTVARIWASLEDAAVMIFPAAEFNRRWGSATAAMLGFAEPGVVFKYPFLVEPLPMHAVDSIVVSTRCDGVNDPRVVRPPAAIGAVRGPLERWILEQLESRGLCPAHPEATDRYPRRDSSPG